ncbi:hypothetical protein KJ059_18490 [Myxococcota bacterium]|nr:hypothetical protein [Myxococcota bacterium]
MRNRSFIALLAILVVLPSFAEIAGAQPDHDAAALGAKLSNPVSDVWALFTEFDVFFSDGDVNDGDPPAGGRMVFQPVLPFPLYGSEEKRWNLITRPIIPILFSQPVPTGFDQFDHEAGLADIQLPMLVAPPTGNWIVGAGPTWLLPTSTHDAFGRQQWGVGPTAVLGYMTKRMTVGVFPQYYFGFADRGDRNDDVPRDASYLNMLYFLIFNLPDAWQVGMNPTITYDHQASSGNKWNVPIGLLAAKTTKIGGLPIKFQLGFEYSVVSQDDFGQRAQIKLNVIPVIPALVRKPLLGGD